MRKIWSVTLREYRAVVQTRAFLISLLLVPVLGGISVAVQVLILRAEAAATKHYVVVDRTGSLQGPIEAACERHNTVDIYDSQTKQRVAPVFRLAFEEPANDAVAQRLELSQRAERGELDGFVDIGPDVVDIVAPGTGAVTDDRHQVRYASDKLADHEFPRWATGAIDDAIAATRFRAESIAPESVRRIQTRAAFRSVGLTKLDPRTGLVTELSGDRRVAMFFVPVVALTLMFLLVVLAAVPAMQGVVEEKQQRIVEVLLGCVSPFELMAGKLLGIVLVSLTTSMVYLAASFFVASRYGALALVTPSLLLWFLVFVVLAVLVFGSLFMAVGAAASDLKETQSLQTAIMMLLALPLMLAGAVLRDPSGHLAVAASFFPFTAPMVMVARLASPPVVPAWHAPVAALGATLTAGLCVWAAGRVFRVGLLLQGKRPRLADLARWVIRG